MQIKVKETKSHRIYSDVSSSHMLAETIVAEGELVLISVQLQGLGVVINGKHYSPIIISKTEKIEGVIGITVLKKVIL